VRQGPFITNFMGRNLAIIVVRNVFFISSYEIDTNVIHLFELFEHQCHMHCLYMNVICLFILFKQGCCMSIHDTLANSLKDSNASPKVKTQWNFFFEVCSSFHKTFGVRGACWSSEMKTRKSDKWVNYSYQFAQTKICYCIVGTHLMNGQVTNIHGFIRFTMTQTLGKPPPSPL
jgi:hypothetical protein